jgi:hypothetical protein
MTEKANIIIIGEVNRTGEDALVEWLESVMREPAHAEATAAHMVENLDGSFADVQGLSVELRGLRSRTGNSDTYSFGAGEYDLVTYNEDGNVIARRVA